MRASSNTRWCPTAEQLTVLEELYRRGLRTPTAAQIQKIAGHLALYGKIQGKNVFYWFQNHKARDRQKLRKKLAGQHHLFYQNHFLHFQIPSPFSLHASPFQGRGVFEDAATTQIWRLDPEKECSMRTNSHDSATLGHAGPTRPLQTLELFPLTSANDQQTPSSSSSINN